MTQLWLQAPVKRIGNMLFNLDLHCTAFKQQKNISHSKESHNSANQNVTVNQVTTNVAWQIGFLGLKTVKTIIIKYHVIVIIIMIIIIIHIEYY